MVRRWLNPPEWVEWVDEPAPGYPQRLVTLRDELQQIGKLVRVGGPAYISSLADGVPQSTHVEDYARIVRRTRHERDLLLAARSGNLAQIEAAAARRSP